MQDLIVSISKNLLKLTVESKDSLEAKLYELDSSIVRDSQIIDVEAFTQILSNAIADINNINVKKKDIVFLVEPSEVFLRFVVIEKDTQDIDQKIVEVAKEKLVGLGIGIEDLYFSYQKIAPFVYQFIAIRQNDLNQYLQISASLGMSLKAVVPWVLLLPKFLPNNDPCVFIIKNPSRHVIALAELNGIYYCEVFSGDKSMDEIHELIQQLSVYKRSSPINKIYTVTSDGEELKDEFEVNPLISLIGENQEAKGYETHMLTRFLFEQNADYLQTQVNLLNLLPLPLVTTKNRSLVVVGATLAVVVLLAGIFGVTRINPTKNNLADNTKDIPVVLSDSSETPIEEAPVVEQIPAEPVKELVKADLNIRVENGAGVQGIAGKTQVYLESKGYTVISIGNSDESGREETLVQFKESAKDYQDLLVQDMNDDYKVSVGDNLDNSVAYDVLVTVGKN